MKFVLLASVIFLTACSTVPVKQKFPTAPSALLEKCPNLLKAEETRTDITDLLKTVVTNYGYYHECSIKQEGWIEWYNKQREIFDKANK